LHEELTEKGVDIYYNDEIERFLGDETVNGIQLKSG
jgi:ferredoxin-nitrate reductase